MAANWDGPFNVPCYRYQQLSCDTCPLQFTNRKEVEELHTVAGDGCVFIKVRAADTESLENFLMEIQSLEGVRSVRSYIALSTFWNVALHLIQLDKSRLVKDNSVLLQINVRFWHAADGHRTRNPPWTRSGLSILQILKSGVPQSAITNLKATPRPVMRPVPQDGH